MRRRIQVDSRCEYDTEITAQEKELGERVMMRKARGCETVWVRDSTGEFHTSKLMLIYIVKVDRFTLLAWIMNSFLVIGHVTAVDPMRRSVAVFLRKN